MSDSVVDFKTGQLVTLIKKRDESRYCMGHCKSILVDTKERKLTCRECGQVVEPFDWAQKMAQAESYLLSNIQRLQSEADKHSTRVEELKTEEQRVKQRIRAAKDSLLKTAGI